jgi:hypothetical protein
MSLSIRTDSVLVGEQKIRARQFTGLVEVHLAKVPGTRSLEDEAVGLIRQDFAPLDLSHFIRGVFKWGGHYERAGRTLYSENHVNPELQPRFRAAAAFLGGPVADVCAALIELNHIKGLGEPSFASKHLRFLCPRFCPVLDSVVAAGVGYERSVVGYGQWSAESAAAARHLEHCAVRNPMGRPGGAWFAGDVDMAIFACLQGW